MDEKYVHVPAELVYLRAGSEPPWERPHRNGIDVTDMPDQWSDYQRQRRQSFVVRVEQYRADGLL